MNTIIDLFLNLWNAMGCVGELLGYLLRFISAFFQSRTSLAARLLAAESQLGICKRRIDQKAQPRPRFTAGFRLLWVILSKFWAPWQAAARLMQPATVKAWHTRAFKIYWRWKSRKKPGRPPITQEMRELIRKLSRENTLWGAGQIRDQLLLLHYDPPCEDTIRKYMVKPTNPRGKSTTWLPFLRNHMDVSWVREFIEDYYHVARPHQGLDGDTPIPQPKADAPITGPTKLISTPILGGLHHRYQRVAA